MLMTYSYSDLALSSYLLRLAFTSLQPSESGVMNSTESESEELDRFHFSSDSAYDSVAYDPVKTRFRCRKQKPKGKPVTMLVLRRALRVLPFCLGPRQSSFHWIIRDKVISGIGTLLAIPKSGPAPVPGN